MGVIDKIAIDLSTKLGDKLQKSIEEKAVRVCVRSTFAD